MIIHKLIFSKEYFEKIPNTTRLRRSYLYLCNQAVTPTLNKLSYRWNKVTCKNCLKQKHSHNSCNKNKN